MRFGNVQVFKFRNSLIKEKANLAIIGIKSAKIVDSEGLEHVPADFLAGAPSALFDAVVVAPSKAGELDVNRLAIDWVRMAYAHLKVIAYTDKASGLLNDAGIDSKAKGVHDVSKSKFACS